MYQLTKEVLAENGYERYEISNYARKGKECIHNLGYWSGIPYLGFGLGASSYFEGKYGKGIIYEIPFHLFSDNVLYSGFGSKIPVKFSVIGDIKGKISSEIEEFGLNNALINLNLVLDISSRVNVPLSSEIVLTKVSIPLYSKIFTGEIPNILPLPVNEYYSSEVKL